MLFRSPQQSKTKRRKQKLKNQRKKKKKKKEERKVRDPRRDGDYERLSESARGREAAPQRCRRDAVTERLERQRARRRDPRRRLRERDPRSAQPSETHDLRERDPRRDPRRLPFPDLPSPASSLHRITVHRITGIYSLTLIFSFKFQNLVNL